MYMRQAASSEACTRSAVCGRWYAQVNSAYKTGSEDKRAWPGLAWKQVTLHLTSLQG